MSARRILWVDVETSGLKQSAPLEIAVIATEMDGSVQYEYQSLVLPAEFFDGTLEIDPKAWHMHLDSGLVLEFEALQEINQSVEEKMEVLQRYASSVIDFELAKALHGHRYMLGGNSVWYDRNVLMQHFPMTYALVDTHRLMDTSSVAEILRHKKRTVSTSRHRAMDDIKGSLTNYRRLLEELK